MDRTINSSRNILCGIVNKLCFAVFSFFIRTAIIVIWGNEYLGLNTLFVSVLEILNLTELGFSSAIIFSMYRPIAERDEKQINCLLAYYRKCYRTIGIVILLLGLFLTPFLKYVIKGDIPKEINIYIIYFINLLNVALGYLLYTYKSSLLIASQRSDIFSNISTILYIFQSFFQLLSIIWLKSYYLYLSITLVITVINNIVISFVVRKKYPMYRCEGILDKREKEQIKNNVFGLLMQKIGSVILTSSDNIVISSFIGLTCVGIYSNYVYILNFLFAFLSVITGAVQASIGNSIYTNCVEKNYKDFLKFNFIYSWIISWMTICLLCLFQPFIELWIGDIGILPMYIVIMIVISFYTQKICEMIVVYKNAAGIWDKGKAIPLCSGLINLMLNLILINYIGLLGVILSTILSLLLINTFGYVFILFKYYFKQVTKCYQYIWKQVKNTLICIVSAIFTYILCGIARGHLGVILIIRFLICLVVPNIVFYFFYRNTKEYYDAKFFLVNAISKVVKRVIREEK